MRIKYSCIYWIFIVLLAFHSVFGQTEIADKNVQEISNQQIDWRIENLIKQVKELFEAYDKADFDKYVELSHPNIYKKTGVSDFYGEVEFIINQSMSSGEELLPTTVESPNVLFESDKRIFGVVTYKLNSVSKDKKDKIANGFNGRNFRRWRKKLEICQRLDILRFISRRSRNGSDSLPN